MSLESPPPPAPALAVATAPGTTPENGRRVRMADVAQGTDVSAALDNINAAHDQHVAQTTEKPRVQAAELPPEALKARLEQEAEKARRAILADLGVTDTKDAKAALAELKRRQDAEKSEAERLNARVAELEAQAGKASSYAAVIASRATAELAALDDRGRAFVTAEAGDDPAKQLATIDRLRASGLLATAPVAAPAVEASAAPVDTAPRPNAPPDAGTVATVNARATYERLHEKNPFAAAAFFESNVRELIP